MRFTTREAMEDMGQPASQVNGFAEQSYEVGKDGMNGDTVPTEETEAMKLSKGAAVIEVEKSAIIVNGIGSFAAIDFSSVTAKDILMTEFINFQAAYDFYNEYGRIKKFLVHVDDTSGRWYVEQFCDNHNYVMLDARFRGLMWSHRSVKEGDLHQINSIRKDGLRVPTIFHAFSNQSRGCETVWFEIKDNYNAIEKQRRASAIDAETTLKFLSGLRSNDYEMFWKHSLDGEKRLQNLFWHDGTSHYNCSVFGDVWGLMQPKMAATEALIEWLYALPFHMLHLGLGVIQSIRQKKGEDTYVWLLWSFLEAMKGKALKSVMTDGDLTMKSVISTIFPGAHHRTEDNVEVRGVKYADREFIHNSNIKVESSKKTSACILFEVAIYCKYRAWVVAWVEEDEEFSCSCKFWLKLRSFGKV
ncbi:Protein FAR-RED IMPAIRED RESPONSE [Arachis hypogaea]|nr:Protein FAR-RED IMPAIRED RESPONSE [Arachis hypogaea]